MIFDIKKVLKQIASRLFYLFDITRVIRYSYNVLPVKITFHVFP